MPKTLFVHLGFHRTGTTSIQVFLRRNADALARRGVLVPASGTLFPVSGHQNIAWQLTGDARYRDEVGGIDDLEAELARSPLSRAVITSEDFTNLAICPQARRRLEAAAARAGYEIRYLAFHRAAADYVPSLYLVIRRLGYTKGYLDYLRQIRRTGRYRDAAGHIFFFDAADFAGNLAGADLRFVSYDAARGDVIGRFLGLIGAPGIERPVEDPVRYRYNRAPVLRLAVYRLIGRIALAGAGL